MINILVAEDDKALRRLMCAALEDNGYSPFPAEDGEAALEIMDHEHIDLIISDIMMPKMDGYELTESLRMARYTLPILMVTAKDGYEDKKKGFDIGTDDYMTKPIDINEMLLRINALLRRSKIANERKLVIGDVTLNYDELTINGPESELTLPKKEFYLLFKLLSYPKKIFTRQQLMEEIWGLDATADERTVDVHIRYLREKLEGYKEFEIVTVRGLGYKGEIK